LGFFHAGLSRGARGAKDPYHSTSPFASQRLLKRVTGASHSRGQHFAGLFLWDERFSDRISCSGQWVVNPMNWMQQVKTTIISPSAAFRDILGFVTRTNFAICKNAVGKLVQIQPLDCEKLDESKKGPANIFVLDD
jgi:hypothetical protein